MKKTKLLAFLTAFVLSAFLVVPAALANETTASQTTSSDATLDFSVTAPASVSIGAANVHDSSAASTGSVTGVNAKRLRGDGATWNVTMTSSHLGIAGASVVKIKTNSGSFATTDIAVTGTYNGLNAQSSFASLDRTAGEIKVTVSTSASAPSGVSVVLPDGTSSTPAFSAGAFTVNGLTATLSGSNWTNGDTFSLLVDAYPYTSLTATPGSLTGVQGAITSGMSLGSGGALVNGDDSATYSSDQGATSKAKTILTSPEGTGMGEYTFNTDLSWGLHKRALAGSYQATFTYSIQ